jgi:ankyrin repeat protein
MKTPAAIWLIAALVDAAPLFSAQLHDAAQKGDVPTIKALLAQGADVNGKDEQGATPLLYATLRSQKATVDFLLSNGAKTDVATKDGVTPLYLAARYGEAEIASMLVAKGAKVDALVSDGKSPLHFAARYGFLEVVRLLVEHGANVNLLDKDGNTPLQFSARYGFLEIARFLVEHGANLNLSDKDGFTPLIFAAAMGQSPIVDYLLSKGANANAVTKSDKPLRTALGMAAWNRYQDDNKYKPIIRALLARGAKDNWLSAVPGFDPNNVSPLLLKQSADGSVMSGSLPFFLAQHAAVRPWKDPGAAGKSDSGTNLFVWETPPNGDKSVTLVVVQDEAGNKTSADALLPAFIGEGGIIYNDGVATISKDGPFAKLSIAWQDGSHHPISGGHVLVTRKSGTVDLTTDQKGTVTSLFRHVTANEPVTVAFNSNDGTSKKVELDCVIRGATETAVQFVIRKTN